MTSGRKQTLSVLRRFCEVCFLLFVFFSVNIKTKHPSQYEQIQQNITDLLF